MVQRSDWCVIVPVRAVSTAKTRLHDLGPLRPSLAESFLFDVLDALAQTESVSTVMIAGPTPPDAAVARDWVRVEWLDTGAAGLNEAIAAAESAARTRGHVRIAVVVSDLPCIRADDLDAVLLAACAHPRAFVSDHDGTGTTILMTTGSALAPEFGAASAARHRRSGAIDIDTTIRVRLDVDTPNDVALAMVYGVGRFTTRVLAAQHANNDRG